MPELLYYYYRLGEKTLLGPQMQIWESEGDVPQIALFKLNSRDLVYTSVNICCKKKKKKKKKKKGRAFFNSLLLYKTFGACHNWPFNGHNTL